MGAIIGSLIGQKYAEKIRKDKFEARMIEPHVMDYLTNPKTPIDDEFGNFLIERAAQHMSGEAKKQWQVVVDKARQYKTATRAAEQAQRAAIPATANPDSIAPQAAPNNAGGIAMPDAVQGNAGMMSQSPQVPAGVQGIASLPSPSPYTQKKTIDAPIAGQSMDPNSGAPPPVSGLPSPGMSTVAPVNSPSQTPPANYFQRAPGRIGEAAAALEAPQLAGRNQATLELKRGENTLAIQLGKERIKALEEAGIQVPDQMKAIFLTGMAVPGLASMNRPVNSPSPVSGSQAPPDTQDIFGNPIDRSGKTDYRVRTYLMSGETEWVPAALANRTGFDKDGNAVQFNPRDPNAAAAAGVVSPFMARPRQYTNAQGNVFLQSPAQLAAGDAGTVVPGAINPSMLPTSTSSSSYTSPSGQATSQKTVVKGLSAPASSGRPGVPATPSVTPARQGGATGTIAPQVRPFSPSNRLDSIVQAIGQDAANWKLATNAADKYQIGERMAQLGIEPGNITGSMRDRAKNARLILQHLDDVGKIINEADKVGDLGVVATRWNDFLTNKLGADPTKGQVFARLSNELGFLSTAVAMAHGGLRGGSSPGMVEHWEKALEAEDPQTLRAKLAEARKWMEGYATLDRGLSNKMEPPMPEGVPRVGDMFGGGKVLKIEKVP